MRKVLLACVAAAGLAGCSMHHDQDRNMQGSGTSTPYAPQARAGEDILPSNKAKTDWMRCDEHPYMPGPSRACE